LKIKTIPKNRDRSC